MTKTTAGSVVLMALLWALGCSSSLSSSDAGTNDTGTDVTGGLPVFGQACAPPGTTCLVDFDGMMTCQPPVQ